MSNEHEPMGIDDLARQLPDGEPDPNDSAVMRRAVLYAIERSRRQRVLAWRIAGVAACTLGGVLAAALLVDPARGRPSPPALVATARLTRIEQREGRATYDVAARALGERFLVVTPDAEVEVRGTRFTVEVDGTATSVDVDHGRVEVRGKDGALRAVLGRGERTKVPRSRPEGQAAAPVLGAAPASAAEPTPQPSSTPRAFQRRYPPAIPRSASEPDQPQPEELRLFRTAHELHFGAGDFGEALRAWNRYLAAFPQGSLAQEARYNRAVCLLRLGRPAEADSDLSTIASTPNAFRAREAKLLRAAALRREGRCEEANRLLGELGSEDDDVTRRAATLPACAGR